MLLVPAAHFQGSPVRTPVTSLNVSETWVFVNFEDVTSMKGYTPCALANKYQCFEGIRCVKIQGPSKKTECIAKTCKSSGSVVTLSWKFTALDCHWFFILLQNIDTYVEASWNVTAHPQNPDFVFRRNGRVHLNRRGRQFSRLLAAQVRTSAVVMLDTPCSEVVWRVLATHSIRQFPLQFPSHASPCAITFQLESIILQDLNNLCFAGRE